MTIASPLTMAPLILAAVLVVSAIAKVRAPESTTSSITLLRLPAFLRTDWFARALPTGELVLAIVMTSPFTLLVRAASVASLALFVAYLAVIVRAMGFSPRPTCGCFGNIGDQRVNGRTVARNVLFCPAGSGLRRPGVHRSHRSGRVGDVRDDRLGVGPHGDRARRSGRVHVRRHLRGDGCGARVGST